MRRMALSYLKEQWLETADRKPLVMRGARQVGKTWAVRQLAVDSQKTLIEINFERTPQIVTLFESNDPQLILTNLSVFTNQTIDPQKSLLFLDEIQAAPEILAKLRWFAEECPKLPVIAAGSLLEFILEDHAFSMPVGRITYLHLEPLSFEEFLLAKGKESLYDYLQKYQFETLIPSIIHEQLMSIFKEYIVVGAMPAAVSNWIDNKSMAQVQKIQNDLLATYRDDFAKYAKRLSLNKLDEIMMSVPRRLGQKYVYSKVNPALNSQTVKQVLSLFNKARVCHRVSGCSANGIPLLSELKEKYFKQLFLDVGLCYAALGGLGSTEYGELQKIDELIFVNNGAVAEQVVGQLLRTINPFYIEPALYYWHRDEEGSNAEIDYVIQHENRVIPIEVKAGSAGSLKSLHLFMESKQKDLAIRVNSNLPNRSLVKVKGRSGEEVDYTLLSIPFYLIGQVHRLLGEEIQ